MKKNSKKDTYRLFFKAFSNPTRISIIQILRKNQYCVSRICRELGLEQSRISHNLSCLAACGFVQAKRCGKETVYSLDKKYILPILKKMDSHIESYKERLNECGVLK